MANTNQPGSPRFQVRLDDSALADLEAVRLWLGERMAAPTPSDAIRAALHHTAAMLKKTLKKTGKTP